MTIHQQREMNLLVQVTNSLNKLMSKAMSEYRSVKKQQLKDNHRYWEIETPYDRELNWKASV